MLRTRNVANTTQSNCIFTVPVCYSERERTAVPWTVADVVIVLKWTSKCFYLVL